jgi:hypothetical protein
MGGALAWSSAAVAIPVAAALGIALAACAAGTARQASSAQSAGQGSAKCLVQAGKAVDGVTLDAVQVDDARVIYDVSVGMLLPHRAAVIAIATSMQESSLLNEPYGTSDSVGLFQQRPSQGWGTTTQIMDPIYASTKFLKTLALVPGWQGLPLTVIAQEVQGSGYPGAYARWEPLANALVATFNGTAAECPAGNGDRGPREPLGPPGRGDPGSLPRPGPAGLVIGDKRTLPRAW